MKIQSSITHCVAAALAAASLLATPLGASAPQPFPVSGDLVKRRQFGGKTFNP
jgi:hypothetical protein